MVKKILIVNTGGMAPGGITYSIYNYVKEIKDNYNVDIYAVATVLYDEGTIKLFKNIGINVINLPNRNSNPIKYFFSLLNLIRRSHFDIIHVHGSSSTIFLDVFAAFLGRIKNVITHSHNTMTNHSMVHKVLQPFLLMVSTKRLACGYEAGKWMYNHKSFRVLNNCIDTSRYRFSLNKRKEIRNLLNCSENIVLGNVGALTNVKNQKFIIKLMCNVIKDNRQIKLLLVGDGNEKGNLKKLTKELNIEDNVIFTGAVSNPEDYMSAIDIIIMPSLYEGLPLTLIEAQANGIPCLVSNSITRDANLTGTVYYLSLKDDMNRWSNEVQNILQTHLIENREKISRKNVKKIIENHFDIKKEAMTLAEIYNIIE